MEGLGQILLVKDSLVFEMLVVATPAQLEREVEQEVEVQ
jgi:hypothetical protein